MDPREEKNRVSLVEEHTQITLNPRTPYRVVNIGSLLEPNLRAELAWFLRYNQDIFTKSYEDMRGIDPQVMSYQINVDPSFHPIK